MHGAAPLRYSAGCAVTFCLCGILHLGGEKKSADSFNNEWARAGDTRHGTHTACALARRVFWADRSPCSLRYSPYPLRETGNRSLCVPSMDAAKGFNYFFFLFQCAYEDNQYQRCCADVFASSNVSSAESLNWRERDREWALLFETRTLGRIVRRERITLPCTHRICFNLLPLRLRSHDATDEWFSVVGEQEIASLNMVPHCSYNAPLFCVG